jgi:hypothetical protein
LPPGLAENDVASDPAWSATTDGAAAPLGEDDPLAARGPSDVPEEISAAARSGNRALDASAGADLDDSAGASLGPGTSGEGGPLPLLQHRNP